MVNRRHIRIKVMQSVYAILQSKNDNLDKEENFLLFNIEKIYDLFVLQLNMLLQVKNMALEHIEIRKHKLLPTAADKNPNLKFIQNKVFQAIESSKELNDFISNKKLDHWKDHREYVRIIWDEIQKKDFYQNYLDTPISTYKEDKKFVYKVYEEIIAPNDKLYDYYDSLNLGWIDDLPLINTLILKTIKQLNEKESIRLSDHKIKKDDKEFLIDLFRKTILHQQEYNEEINNKTPNWDTDRIAEIDLILIKMAVTEFLYFPSIPTKVTINEYIEISKDYSTSKSSYFINGVLDKLLKDYHQSDRLKKIGRGLL